MSKTRTVPGNSRPQGPAYNGGGSPICRLACPEIPRYAASMSIAKKLLHTRYRVNDLERTVKFYREVLGLQEIRRHKSPRGSELASIRHIADLPFPPLVASVSSIS